jgi:ectoine hydroxylase-related dioxygenase (phytanoyl-CoA dioxygenase family)
MNVGKISFHSHKKEIADTGFTIIENVFSETNVDAIIKAINKADTSNPNFRITNDLFAVRQFLKEVPESIPFIFTERLKAIITELFGEDYFVVKSIYFDKPENSNWCVSYHQDLMISVDKKIDIEGFGPWTVKQNQFAVQPSLDILESNFTIRIHLDATDENNGALRVIPKSHLKGIHRPDMIDWSKETETVCNVPKGGIMIMKPLLLHASSKTINNKKRRVIHIELSNQKKLPEPLQWSEAL